MADELAPLQLVPIPPQSLLYGIDIGQCHRIRVI
jgi:hypothetical protein